MKKGSDTIYGAADRDVAGKISEAILGFVAHVPKSKRHKSDDPEENARAIANESAAKSALAAGTMALPPGPLGLLTILPELVSVWRIQAQMVSDIAAIYGKEASLTREQMIYCLFRHSAAQAVRDLVARVGERFLVRRASLRAFQGIAQKIGVRITQRVIGKGLSRWVPLLGAVGVAGYAYYDTAKVAQTAIELFRKEIDIEAQPSAPEDAPQAARP
jgi:hypothetical protein